MVEAEASETESTELAIDKPFGVVAFTVSDVPATEAPPPTDTVVEPVPVS